MVARPGAGAASEAKVGGPEDGHNLREQLDQIESTNDVAASMARTQEHKMILDQF
jgi:hypothetical protein